MTFDFETPPVQPHLEMQGLIQRMVESSRSCKLWSSTALSAARFLAARRRELRENRWICIVFR